MFSLMPSSKDTRRRHPKKASPSKRNGPPSLAVSTVSSSSASSSATVTTPSRSIFPSSLRPSKRPDAKLVQAERSPSEHSRSRSRDDTSKENLDVFAFMEEEEDEEYASNTGEEKSNEEQHEEPLPSRSGSASRRMMERPQRSPRYSDLEVRTISDSAQRVWARESLHSDSGISDMRSSSPDQESPTLQKKLPTLPDEPWAEVDGQDAQYSYPGAYGIQGSPDLSGERRPSAFRHKHWPSFEEANHGQSPGPYYPRSPARMIDGAHDNVPESYSRTTNQLVRGTSSSREIVSHTKPDQSGYELLASEIGPRGDAVLRPIYRKFETLNNRMLLYLQDEISEMEDQLRELDNAIAHEERANGGKPASRRAEAKLPSQLQWHRLDLLGRSFAKVEQYNRALTSYSNLTKSLDPASVTDITAYRSWIIEHTPIAEQEASFLHKGSDLLAVSSEKAPRINSRAGTALETPVVLVAFALLATIVVFKVVPTILGRLVISTMVGVASLCTLSPEVITDLTCARDWRKAIATYSAIMLVLAVVVS